MFEYMLVLLAVIPVVLIMIYVYNKDRNKEPTKLLVSLFILGIISCFLTLALTDVMAIFLPIINEEIENLTNFEKLISVFIGVALIEEFSKWVMAYSVGYKSKEFDEIFDSIVYAVFVSLGFAMFENLLYVLSNKSITVGLFRGFLSVPGHACYALYMGYFLSLAKVFAKKGRKDLEKLYLLFSIVVPAILHGIYDYCLLSDIAILLLVFLLFIILLYVFSIRRLLILSKDTTRLAIKNKFCHNCGHPVKENYCGNCGARQE